MAEVDLMLSSDDDFHHDDDTESDFDDEENIVVTKKRAAPKKTAPKKTAATKKTTTTKKKTTTMKKKAPLTESAATNEMDDSDEDGMFVEPPPKPSTGKEKSIEETYQKKSQLEHILLRPDTYIGSTERVTEQMYVLDTDKNKIVEREITFTPGLYKIFDEIVVNAADNKQRDFNMDKLDITVDQENNEISVKNNGKGIPVQMHKGEGIHVPTLIFGHLLTGSNFDDDEKKTTGGRNGYGAKLANIFSTKFIVECVDVTEGAKFTQVFENNMSTHGTPIIKKISAAEKKKGDSTKITFCPDLARFKMTSLDDDAVALFSKRAYDIAGSMAARPGKRLAVTLNGEKLPVKSFKDYLGCFEGLQAPAAYEKTNDRWEVGVGISESCSFQQISFVNAICTSKGGSHVAMIADQITDHIKKTLKKKKHGGDVKANIIKQHLSIYVNCLIENPKFDSQTKEFLTNQKKTFSSTCKLSDKLLKQIDKSGVIDAILNFAKFQQSKALAKKGGVKKVKLSGIAKLDDANNAGTRHSKDCTLIITEGDSAKSLAMSGLSVVGRDFYGVFPLKGKPLNVREATHQQIMKNEEIKSVVDIMGLKYGVQYDESNIKSLRYGHLMIMADQDHDGSHIKGLVINIIHHFWPTLLDIPGFLQQFITPIVKVSKGKTKKTFFTIPEYEGWKESTGNEGKGWKIKYYKGLGTSTAAEAKEYFQDLRKHEIHFGDISSDKHVVKEEIDTNSMDVDEVVADPDRCTSGSDLIDMCFSKSRVSDRKNWLNHLEKHTFLDYSLAKDAPVKYSDFINKELILFSQADNQRSIPHYVDGFKPSQRKVLFSCFKRNLKNEIKVAQLAGYVSEHSAYHHGEASLAGTIINMAQTFVGSNNINLLFPQGQFGTRRMGGKDCASPRYVFTFLEQITRQIYHPDDDALLTYLNDDGLSVEPEFYMPVIPMILVNGADGIGTGWSTSIPCYNPREIMHSIRSLIRGEEIKPMKPYYHGYTGEIAEKGDTGNYSVQGRIERVNDTTLKITELPLKKWTHEYKVFLEVMLVGDGKKKEPEIKDFLENHTDATVDFTVIASKEQIDEFEKDKNGLVGKFKLTSNIATSNMNAFDTEGRIIKFNTPEQILHQFFTLRLDFYSRRKALLLDTLRREQRILSNKARFVEEVCRDELIVSNRKRAAILAELKERGYELFDNKKVDNEDEESDEEDANLSDAELARGYEYLLGMKIWSLTFEKAEELRRQLEEKNKAVKELEATSPSQIWLNDLDAIEVSLDERDTRMAKDEENEKKANTKGKKNLKLKTQKKKTAAAKKKSKKAGDWDSELEDGSSDDGGEKNFFSSDDEEAAPKQKASTRKPAVKKTVSKKTAGKRNLAQSKITSSMASATIKIEKETLVQTDKETPSLDAEVKVEFLSLSQRLKEQMIVSPPAKKIRESILKREHVSSTDQAEENNLSLDDFDATEFKPASLTPRASKGTKKPPAKKARGKNAAGASKEKPASTIVDSDSDDFFDDDDSVIDEVISAPAPVPTRTGRATRKTKMNYAVDLESSDDDFSLSD